MDHVTFTPIVVPTGTNIRLFSDAACNLVVAAPAGIEADPGLMLRPGVTGVFTFDDGLTWPDQRSCAAATAYLAAGYPICLMFDDAAAATACHQRLLEMAQ